MKIILPVLFLLSSQLLFGASSSPQYNIDEQMIDMLLENGTDVSHTIQQKHDMALSYRLFRGITDVKEDDKQLIAGVVALGGIVFTGGIIGALIPVHRFILGTAGNEMPIFFGYFCTYGMCGILPIVDGIALLIDAGGNKYMNNPRWIMW